jgi:PAS domain S-box-containing protein
MVHTEDITERKRAEDERVKAVSTAADREKAAVIDALPHSIIVLKLDGKIISANSTHLKMFGHKSADEIIGTGIERFRERFADPEKDFPRSLKLLKEIIKKGFVEEPLEIRFRRVDGKEFIGAISANLLRDVAGNPKNIIVTITDITERKQIEEEMLKNEKKLALAEKLAAVGEVATQVGHDLRNPLTSIKGAAYYLKTNKAVKLDKTAKKMLDTIDDSIKYADKIITDLLDFSQEIKLKPVRKTVKEVVADALSSIKIPKKVEVIDSTESELTIHVDPLLIRRVLHNVFINAFDAMPDGGTLEIESKENNKNVSIKICDSGAGMPKKVIEKLYTPFFTTKAKGVGLGLAICKRIVEAHGGSIGIESKVGKGTCVTIILPKKTRII